MQIQLHHYSILLHLQLDQHLQDLLTIALVSFFNTKSTYEAKNLHLNITHPLPIIISYIQAHHPHQLGSFDYIHIIKFNLPILHLLQAVENLIQMHSLIP